MKTESISHEENRVFKKKYSNLKKTVKRFVYENAALCDQVFQLQEKIIGLKEERSYLFKRFFSHEAPVKLEPVDQPLAKVQAPSTSQKSAIKKKDAAWEKVKSRKPSITLSGKKKTIGPVPVDSSGVPVFPVNLGSLSVHSLGEIVTDRMTFHGEDVIYPAGFCSTRVYGSINDPATPCIYTCMILDGGSAPLFEIASDTDHEPSISGEDINAVHAELLRRINNTLGMEVVGIRGRGADFFGVSHPTVLNLLQSLPGVNKCSNYKFTKFEINKSGDPYMEENDAALTFESLQRSISFTKSQMEDIRQQETIDSTTTLRDLLNA